MRRSRYSEKQILEILKEAEGGRTVQELCRHHGISEQTLYRCKSKFGGMQVSEMKRLRDLEDKNRRLMRLVADLSLDDQALKAVLNRKW